MRAVLFSIVTNKLLRARVRSEEKVRCKHSPKLVRELNEAHVAVRLQGLI